MANNFLATLIGSYIGTTLALVVAFLFFIAGENDE